MHNQLFSLHSPFQPKGDQPFAIEKLYTNFQKEKEQVLLGITGSGKTFTMAHLIQKLQKKTLIIAPNKTLAGQLYFEFKEFFPHNAVEYFISYYDYYRPESYLPQKNLFFEKEATINEQIDKMRHSTTSSLLEREDVIVIASVSCIYGLGSPEDYEQEKKVLFTHQQYSKNQFIDELIHLQYKRTFEAVQRGEFFLLGNTIDLYPSFEQDQFFRIEFLNEKIESITLMDHLSQRPVKQLTKLTIYPMSHYLIQKEQMKKAIINIEKELKERLQQLRSEQKILEAERLESRTKLDLTLLKEIGFCRGVENYSRHLTGLKEGEAPYTLIDYFKKNFFLIIDESHLTIPQIRGMYSGDRSRKETLVNYGFRLKSALDNRPLNFKEFEQRLPEHTLYVSATPGPYELNKVKEVVEQIQRPTGLLDPILEILPSHNQVEVMIKRSKEIIAKGERILITTTRKKLAEQLASFYEKEGLKSTYLHSDIGALDRLEILKKLRTGEVDILIGINLLREGLDLPEVSLVAIFDADKEGFLRSKTSLIQIIGRAARHIHGRVLLFADHLTESLQEVIQITQERRKKQEEFNKKNNIIIEGIVKKKPQVFEEENFSLDELRLQLKQAIQELNFKQASQLRDKIRKLV